MTLISFKRVLSTASVSPQPKRPYSKNGAVKGHFVVYSMDMKRFVVPLEYLQSNVFTELFRMAEEVFGLPADGPIVLPFDGAILKYIISFVKSNNSLELQKAVIVSLRKLE